MPTRPESFRETLIVIDFVAFGKQRTEFEFDCTYEQLRDKIWKEICPTAIILFAWQYGVHEPVNIKIKKTKLTDDELANNYKKL